MKKPLVLAASALFVLIGAAYPDGQKPDDADNVATAAGGNSAQPAQYRPCRRGRGDDRCIQLYERGMRTAYARWLRGDTGAEPATRLAQGGPYEPRSRHAAPRHAHDEHCTPAPAPVSAPVSGPDAESVRGM